MPEPFPPSLFLRSFALNMAFSSLLTGPCFATHVPFDISADYAVALINSLSICELSRSGVSKFSQPVGVGCEEMSDDVQEAGPNTIRHERCSLNTSGTQSSSEWSSGWLLRGRELGGLEGRYHG